MSTTHSTEEAVKAPRRSPSGRALVRFLSSIKLGIVLMLAIAASAVLGTIVPQGDESAIQSLQMSEGTKHLLLAIHAQNVYYSPWFLGLLALFFVNLLVATWRVGLPRLRVALRKPPEVTVSVQERYHLNKVVLPEQPLDDVARAFKAARYRVYPNRHGGLIAHKGRWSRFAPLVTHLGLFMVLLGALASGLTSFKASVPMFEGETLPARHIIEHMAQQRGAFASSQHDWDIRVDRFWMDYYDNQTVRQYHSAISILREGQVVATKSIFVNDPLVYDGVWFYQAFWGVGAVQVQVAGKAMRVDMEEASRFGMEGTLSRIVPIGTQQYALWLRNEKAPLTLLLLDPKTFAPTPVANVAAGQTTLIAGVPVRFEKPVLYSGLQTKADPGIPVVYTGFLIVILGSMLAFFAVRTAWVGPLPAGGYLVSGKANRGQYAFQRELVKLATQLGAKGNATHGA